MGAYDVETVTVDGQTTALGSAGSLTLVVDRPLAAGGGGKGFNGGQLLNLAVAGCVSNDLFREAASRGITLRRVVVRVRSDYVGVPSVSTTVEYDVEIDADGEEREIDALLDHVDAIAEIPNSLRRGTDVRMASRIIRSGG